MKKLNKIQLAVIIILVILAAFSSIFSAYIFFNRHSGTDKSLFQMKEGKQNEMPIANYKEGFFEKVVNFAENKLGIEKDGKDTSTKRDPYLLHKNITSTIFWVGEKASDDNDNISNSPSAWDDKWKEHYGGIDNPDKRAGFYPSKFIPKENPFYAALPYNDFNEKGNRKHTALSTVPWANGKPWQDNESLCKNQWIKIEKGDKVAYAQWEDVGPFGENDVNYVFGKSLPKNKENKSAGIDLSPAVKDFLNLDGMDKVTWQFVEEKDVPDGPWKNIITRSNIDW
jgi:hypothetical protein